MILEKLEPRKGYYPDHKFDHLLYAVADYCSLFGHDMVTISLTVISPMLSSFADIIYLNLTYFTFYHLHFNGYITY